MRIGEEKHQKDSWIYWMLGDLVYLSAENDQVKLDQIPQAQASLISFNPKTGEVLSYVGGSVFNDSQFEE
ncbi:MAG: hypothetical protein Ct9H90mP6_10220 [Gammaproteobacteria bacterium]|nr:MAG: hypothetical protein Ct9H90mP6_10220 [Gammaproteobacteria bacterium]